MHIIDPGIVGLIEAYHSSTHPMNNEIALLSQFLDSLGPEVSGHSSSALTPDQIERIQLFAAGKLSPEDRAELLPGILENEKALRELVQTLQVQGQV